MKRYEPGTKVIEFDGMPEDIEGHMNEDVDGDYVLYSDAEKLENRVKELENEKDYWYRKFIEMSDIIANL